MEHSGNILNQSLKKIKEILKEILNFSLYVKLEIFTR